MAGLAIVAMGLFFVYADWQTAATVKAAARWPSTMGTIQDVKVPDDGVYARYAYTVDGTNYVSTRVLPAFAWTRLVVWINGEVEVMMTDSAGANHSARYAFGKPVKVYYNPAAPRESLLIPYAPSLAPFRYAGMLFALLGLAFTRAALQQPPRSSRRRTR